MKRKIVGILVCMLVMATVFPIIQAVNEDKKEATIAPLETNAVIWSKTYGGPEFDELRDVEQTTDGGYIACGETEVSNNFYPWVLKVDAAGDEEWNWTLTQVTYNGTTHDIIDVSYQNCIHQISDGGYIVCLQIPFMSDTEEYAFGGLAKLSATGAEEWVQIYAEGFTWTFWPNSFSIVDDGYIIAGDAGDPAFTGSTDYDTGILKTNTNGVEQWHHVWDFGPFPDYCWGVCHTNDNGYFCTGYYGVTSSVGRSFMIKTDANGNEQWNKTFSGSKGDYIQSRNCYQTPDNGYIMGGYTYSYGAGNSDPWIVKTDSSGTILWNKTYGDKSRDSCFSFEKTTDGGYVICNTNNWSSAGGDKEDTFLIKIDGSGNTKWIQKYGGPGRQIGEDVNATNDGGFIVPGRTGLYQDSASDAFLAKFAPIDMTIDIKGGLGIQTTIKNNGIANLTNVSYEVNVQGGILGLINKTISGWINVSAGETLPLDKIMVFGLGSITITAKVADEEQIVKGTQLIIFSMVKT